MNGTIDMQSRRSFCKTMAAGVAGISIVSLAGASPVLAGASEAASSTTGSSSSTATSSSASSTTTGALGSVTTTADSITWDEEFDVVIAGSGIAGLSAALTVAREAAGKTCLLAEKDDRANGCSPVCSGDFLFSTVDDLYPVQYLKDMATTSIGQSIPDDVLEAFATGIDENLNWVCSLGLSVDQLTLRYVHEDRTKAEYREFDSWASPEATLTKTNDAPYSHLYLYLNSLVTGDYADAIDYRLECPLTGLVKDETSGAILGAVIGGKYIKANDGVIMACGGYEHNSEFLEGFCGCGSAISFAGTGNTGDGHVVCAGIGADFWHMHNAAGFWMAGRDLANENFSNGPLASHKHKNNGITVAKNGRRFYMDWDGHKSLDISDDEISEDLSMHVGSRHGVMQFGGEWGHLPMPSIAWFVFDADHYEDAFDFEFTGSTDPVADGWLLTADTIEDLADQMGVPSDQLANTIETWNDFCDKGEDRAFYRPVETLTPIVTAPFYAQLCNPAMLNTDGGPKRSAKAEILGVDGNPIPGLYSAGEFGSVWGYLYNGNGNVAEAMVFGRIAARTCCGITEAPTYDTAFTMPSSSDSSSDSSAATSGSTATPSSAAASGSAATSVK